MAAFGWFLAGFRFAASGVGVVGFGGGSIPGSLDASRSALFC